MDTGETIHMASDTGILRSIFNNRSSLPEHVIVGNGSTILISSHGAASLPNTSFTLSPTCVAPSIGKNLIFVRQFTHDNSCF